ncbi:MAG: hypothetical protein A2001_13880 [Treponema sp. GWC1_61_84]|nr:MAG: hypothetical protein A2001_13880 [Treponema sp. GWC1_61_84]
MLEKVMDNFREYNLMNLQFETDEGALISVNHNAPKYNLIKNRKDGNQIEMLETYILNYFETMQQVHM